MDFIRIVFDRLYSAGSPDAQERAVIYAECRDMVTAAYANPAKLKTALEELEKVIRRQEMQALYEESLQPRGGK